MSRQEISDQLTELLPENNPQKALPAIRAFYYYLASQAYRWRAPYDTKGKLFCTLKSGVTSGFLAIGTAVAKKKDAEALFIFLVILALLTSTPLVYLLIKILQENCIRPQYQLATSVQQALTSIHLLHAQVNTLCISAQQYINKSPSAARERPAEMKSSAEVRPASGVLAVSAVDNNNGSSEIKAVEPPRNAAPAPVNMPLSRSEVGKRVYLELTRAINDLYCDQMKIATFIWRLLQPQPQPIFSQALTYFITDQRDQIISILHATGTPVSAELFKKEEDTCIESALEFIVARK